MRAERSPTCWYAWEGGDHLSLRIAGGFRVRHCAPDSAHCSTDDQMFPYEKLDAHKVLHELAVSLYRATDAMQDNDVHEIIARLRWAANRAPAKLAHGSVRCRRVFVRFVGLVMGYLIEIADLLRAAHDLCLIPEATWRELDAVRGRASFYTNKLWEDLSVPEPPAGTSAERTERERRP